MTRSRAAEERRIEISDATLREGDQAFGVVLGPREKVEIATLLDEVGIAELEVGFPAQSGEVAAHVDTLVARRRTGRLKARLIGWHKPEPDSIAWSHRRGLDGCTISAARSIYEPSGRARAPEHDVVVRSVAYAKGLGMYVVASFQESFLVPLEGLLRSVEACGVAGADRVRLSDTGGHAHPLAVAERVMRVIERCEVDVEVHMHDDLGMAVGNAVAAAAAFVSAPETLGRRLYISTTVNGIGERAGIAGLERVVASLHLALGIDVVANPSGLRRLCERVGELSGRPVAPAAPVVGRLLWSQATSGHADTLATDPGASEPIPPEWVGARPEARTITLGQHSSVTTVREYFAARGIDLSLRGSLEVLNAVKRLTLERKRFLTEDELMRLVEDVEPMSSRDADG